MPSSHHLGELSYAIMRVLWDSGEATVAQVVGSLPRQHRRATTTIATMLAKMERKGVVDHVVQGRVFVYRPRVTQHAVRRRMVGDLTDRLFGGDVSALVSHLLDEREIEPEELARLSQLVARRRREGRGHARP